MIALNRLHDRRNGQPTRAYFIQNRHGKPLAFGAMNRGSDAGFLIMVAPRYERDQDLVAACERLVSIPCRQLLKGASK